MRPGFAPRGGLSRSLLIPLTEATCSRSPFSAFDANQAPFDKRACSVPFFHWLRRFVSTSSLAARIFNSVFSRQLFSSSIDCNMWNETALIVTLPATCALRVPNSDWPIRYHPSRSSPVAIIVHTVRLRSTHPSPRTGSSNTLCLVCVCFVCRATTLCYSRCCTVNTVVGWFPNTAHARL